MSHFQHVTWPGGGSRPSPAKHPNFKKYLSICSRLLEVFQAAVMFLVSPYNYSYKYAPS